MFYAICTSFNIYIFFLQCPEVKDHCVIIDTTEHKQEVWHNSVQ